MKKAARFFHDLLDGLEGRRLGGGLSLSFFDLC
jgi:hypothetical protein